MSDADVIIRAATKEDMVPVANMIQELADFEKMPDGPTLTSKDLLRDCFETQPPEFRCLVAELTTSKRLVGFAIYFPIYSTWRGKAMFLEDLYVHTDVRGRGVGQQLFDAVAKEANSRGCAFVDFHVLKWNPARSFYHHKGAVDMTGAEDWLYYRLSDDALKRAASNAK